MAEKGCLGVWEIGDPLLDGKKEKKGFWRYTYVAHHKKQKETEVDRNQGKELKKKKKKKKNISMYFLPSFKLQSGSAGIDWAREDVRVNSWLLVIMKVWTIICFSRKGLFPNIYKIKQEGHLAGTSSCVQSTLYSVHVGLSLPSSRLKSSTVFVFRSAWQTASTEKGPCERSFYSLDS